MAGNAKMEYDGPRSVTRLLRLFGELARANEGRSLAELSLALGSPKSSLLNLLRPLVAEGCVVHSGTTYFIGPAMFRLAAGIMAAWSFPKLIRPLLIELAERSGETAVLSLLDRNGCMVTYVEIIEGAHPIRYHIPMGTTRPIMGTAAGKVMLAYSESDWRDAYLKSVHFPVRPAHPDFNAAKSSISKTALLRELEDIRKVGVGVSIDRYIKGVSALAAPVFDADQRCIAALTIAGPSERFRASVPSLSTVLKEIAARASGAAAAANDHGPI